jgi:excisionase family DNA binding protein
MQNSFDIDRLIDVFAERVAAKLRDQTAESGGAAMKPRLLTPEQAGAYLGRTKEGVEHMVAAGKLPVVRADRRVFLDVRDLDRWIERNKT